MRTFAPFGATMEVTFAADWVWPMRRERTATTRLCLIDNIFKDLGDGKMILSWWTACRTLPADQMHLYSDEQQEPLMSGPFVKENVVSIKHCNSTLDKRCFAESGEWRSSKCEEKMISKAWSTWATNLICSALYITKGISKLLCKQGSLAGTVRTRFLRVV